MKLTRRLVLCRAAQVVDTHSEAWKPLPAVTGSLSSEVGLEDALLPVFHSAPVAAWLCLPTEQWAFPVAGVCRACERSSWAQEASWLVPAWACGPLSLAGVA